MPKENTMKFEHYNILITPSSELFDQVLVVMMSAIINCKHPCRFYIMQCTWTEQQKEECRTFISAYPKNTVEFIEVDENDFKFFTPWKGRFGTYYKLLAHLYLPDSVDRILYLDCDSFINKDIYNYYSMDFEDNYLIGSTETLSLEIYNRFRQQGLEKHGYMNGGVVLLNIRKLKQDKITIDTYLNALSKFEGKYFADQGIASYVFDGKIKLLPSYKYNHLLFQEGTEKQNNTYKRIFSTPFKERTELFIEEFWNEEYDEEQDATIVHFAGVYVEKPWLSIPEIISDDISDIQHVVEIPYINRTHLTKDVVEQFYVGWWRVAAHLPVKYFYQLLVDAEHTSKTRAQGDLWGTRNALNFCYELSNDYIGPQRYLRYIGSLAEKKIVLLKCFDKAGVLTKKIAENISAEIVFSSGKATLKELTDEEFAECKKADVIISCCVHGTKTHERDGVKCIDIWDILRDESLTADLPPLISTDTALLDAVTAELRAAREELSAQNTQIAAKLNEYHSSLERVNMLEQRIKELDTDKDKLNIELGRMSAENQILSDRLSKSDKLSSELRIERDNSALALEEAEKKHAAEISSVLADKDIIIGERDKLNNAIKELEDDVGVLTEKNKALNADKERIVGERDKLRDTIKKLEGNVRTLTERNRTIGEQNEQLTASVGDLSVKLSSAEERAKKLEYEQEELGRALTQSTAETKQAKDALSAANQEIERLKDKLYQMENSRSWRYTRIFRKKPSDE